MQPNNVAQPEGDGTPTRVAQGQFLRNPIKSSMIQTAEVIQKPIKQGHIKKWTNMVTRFQKRYFVLDPELLCYYKDSTATERGQISLRLARVDPRSKTDKRMLINTGTSEIHLKFKSVEEKNEWFKAILECQQRLQSMSSTSLVEGMDFEESKSENNQKAVIQQQEKRGLDKEIKDALSVALSTNILKEDSLLARNVAETWSAQKSLEDALEYFMREVQKSDNPNLIKLGEQIYISSDELKHSITNAVKQIDSTKLQIIKILEMQDQQLMRRGTLQLEKGPHSGEESNVYHSFSQDFNDLIEHKKKLDTLYEMPIIEEDERVQPTEEEDSFYDANCEDENLKKIQSEIHIQDDPVQIESSRIEEYRTTLPALKPADQKVSVWKVIKDAVGKDLSRFCVPVYFNEPISMLQKVSEIMEYENLLVKAGEESDSMHRLLMVSALGIVQYKCSDKRTNKPFNPILGETFELKRPNYLYFAEQVSHHPPISACYAESELYEYWMNSSMKTTFWGKSLEVKPLGFQHVRLKKSNEHFTIERPSSQVNNLIFGEMYVEHSGIMTIKNLMTGEYAEIDFKKRGWSGKGAFEVEGYAYNSKKEKKYKIWGKWIDKLYIKNLETQTEENIWTANPMPPNSDQMYHFTYFTLQLNHLPPGLKMILPPSDSRLRPDQRALEEGDLTLATKEKMRLEDKQRQMRKDRELKGEEFKPKYFAEYTDPDTGEKGYKMVRDYWADRKTRNWSHLEDLFGE